MSAAEEAEFCDGVKLMAWLREVEPKLFGKRWEGSPGQVRPMIGDNWNRRFYDWTRGACPSVYTVDKLMVALGRHLLEIPDECFCEERRYNESPERKWQRERAVEMVAEGYHKLEVARQMGVSRATIARWVEKERAAA